MVLSVMQALYSIRLRFNALLMLHAIAVAACYLLYATAAVAVEVKYDPPYLSIEAENESLESVLLKVTEQAGGKVTGPQSVLHERINFEGESNDARKLLWKLLRQYNSAVSWSGDGKHILEIRLLKTGGTSTLVPRPDNALYQNTANQKQLPDVNTADIASTKNKVAVELQEHHQLTADEQAVAEAVEAAMGEEERITYPLTLDEQAVLNAVEADLATEEKVIYELTPEEQAIADAVQQEMASP